METKRRFLRSSAGSFILFGACGTGPDALWAIEVKHAANIDGKDLRALRAFREDYPEASVCLLYLGRDRLEINGILCIPCEEFFRGLHPEGAALYQ